MLLGALSSEHCVYHCCRPYFVYKISFQYCIFLDEEVDEQPVKRKARTLRHQVQDLSKLQESTIADILRKSVIYDKGIYHTSKFTLFIQTQTSICEYEMICSFTDILS